jgi:hypothetical protein
MLMIGGAPESQALGLWLSCAPRGTPSRIEMDAEAMGAAARLAPVDPSYARKLLRDVVGGFAPHRDFTVAERMLADVSLDGCETAFRFGRDGKPFNMPGPSESRATRLSAIQTGVAREGGSGEVVSIDKTSAEVPAPADLPGLAKTDINECSPAP